MDPVLALSSVEIWAGTMVVVSFALYIGISIWSRSVSTSDFYVAGKTVSAVSNGMATAAGWMSAASFIAMAGMVAFIGYDATVYLMGWTGGFVLLALLLAPYLRKFGKFTVPDFVGDRYYSSVARVVAVVCAIFVSFTYVCGQMRGVGIVFSRFVGVEVETGVIIGIVVVFFYSVVGGMRGITYTQVAQYCVLIFAYLVPAIFISIMLTNNPVPQLGMGGTYAGEGGGYLLDKLDGLNQELGFASFTDGSKETIDVFTITMALMVGTAGLPHVIVRFYTVKKVKDARASACWALIFIAILYTTAPAVGVFARTNLLATVAGKPYRELPEWFRTWEDSGLIAWVDKNGDGIIQYVGNEAKKDDKGIVGNPVFEVGPDGAPARGPYGQRLLKNALTPSRNELYVDRDIMVLANPEIAGLPNWVVGLVAAGGLAAALSTAGGLLLVISTSFAHDLMKKTFTPGISEKRELMLARVGAGVAVVIAGLFGIFPPGWVAEVVAFAFGLAASSFFPAIIMGVFYKRMNKEGAIAGMVTGIVFTTLYIVYFKFVNPAANTPEHWWLGISPEGIGTVGMIINFAVALLVSRMTPPPPVEIQELVEHIRWPEERE